MANRLRRNELFRYFHESTFDFRGTPFLVELEHFGVPLTVRVREFESLRPGGGVNHAYEQGEKSVKLFSAWDPPIIMAVQTEDQLRQELDSLRVRIYKAFQGKLRDPERWKEFTQYYFGNEIEEGSQGQVLQLLGHYYRKDLREHAILETSLGLLWWESLLRHKFVVPERGWRQLEKDLESPRPPGDLEYVIPDMLNRLLKATVMHVAIEAAKRLTEALHEMLFKQAHTPKTSTRGGADLALCLLLILKMYLGRTQTSLQLLVGLPDHEKGIKYTLEDAQKTIREMDEVGEYYFSLYQYTLSRCQSAPTPHAEVDSPFEQHSRDFDLQGRLVRDVIKDEAFGKLDSASTLWRCADEAAARQRPASFEVGALDDTFYYANVRRHCWKVLDSIRAYG
jgi:hypothetical protein